MDGSQVVDYLWRLILRLTKMNSKAMLVLPMILIAHLLDKIGFPTPVAVISHRALLVTECA
ncbi:Uncharacterised protein [Vibrio cholerae]|nr:Uncharacterised protein [Vibrio cholerae]